MPRPNFTSVVLLIDRSGSMAKIAEATVAGINHFVEDQKTAPGDGDWTLYQFDDPNTAGSFSWTEQRTSLGLSVVSGKRDFPEPIFVRMPQAAVRRLQPHQFVPRGNTALIDAACLAIDRFGELLAATPEHDRPAHVVFVIVTDGLENVSTRFKRADLNRRIAHQREKYAWQFVFLGANQDAIQEGTGYGVPVQMCSNYAGTGTGTGVGYRNVSKGLKEWKTGGCLAGALNIDPGIPEEPSQVGSN